MIGFAPISLGFVNVFRRRTQLAVFSRFMASSYVRPHQFRDPIVTLDFKNLTIRCVRQNLLHPYIPHFQNGRHLWLLLIPVEHGKANFVSLVLWRISDVEMLLVTGQI